MMVRGREPAAVPLSGGAGVGRNAAVQRGWRGRVAVVRRRIVQIQIGHWRDVVVRVLVLGLHRQRRDVVRAPPVVRVRLLGLRDSTRKCCDKGGEGWPLCCWQQIISDLGMGPCAGEATGMRKARG